MKAQMGKNIKKLLKDIEFSKNLLKSINDLDNKTSTEFKVNDVKYTLKEVK